MRRTYFQWKHHPTSAPLVDPAPPGRRAATEKRSKFLGMRDSRCFVVYSTRLHFSTITKFFFKMKFLLSLACMCLFLLAGSVLSVQSQDAPEVRTLFCDNGECSTLVIESRGGWAQAIDCGYGIRVFFGTGPYEGTVCGMTME